MKKFLGLLSLIVLLNGCDDGDMKVEAINFDDVNASSCGEIIYKIKGTEALFLKIPASLQAFKNEITPADTPRIIPIGGNVVVRYRGYNGTVTANNLCPDVIQPIFPIATVEWIATAGSIEITTTPISSTPDALTGATRLTKYNHNIVFKLITFAKAAGEQRYDTFNFGDYTTNATTLPLVFLSDNARICTSGNTVYNAANGGIEGMFIQNIDPALLSTATLNEPKTALIGTTSNMLTYRLFKTALATDTNDAYFCSSPFPTSPEINEEWLADNGMANTSGIIEVTTTRNSPGTFRHKIRLKGVTFKKGSNSFYYGNDILFGEVITN